MASFLDRAKQKLEGWINGDELKLETPEDQTPEEKALVAFVDNQLEKRRSSSARVAMEGIALTNVAYLCGFDSIYFDGFDRQFKPIPAPNQLIAKNRVHVNRILPTCQNRLARLCKNPPRYEVRPNSADEDDKDAARLSEMVLLQLWEQLEINRKRLNLMMWVQQAGTCYLKVVWDETLGRKKVLPVEKQKEDGQTEITYELVTEGDIRVDIASFFEVFPDSLAKTWEECTSLIHAKIRPLSYFRDHYPARGHLVKEEACWLNSLQYESRINALNTQTGASGLSTNQIEDSAIERMYYEAPSKKHPMGRHIVTANGVLLKDGVLPIDELPWIKFDDILVGGKFNGEAIITHLRPLQDQINRGKSMRAAWLNRMLTGKWVAARGHNLAREAFNDQSGEVLEFDHIQGVKEPHAMDVPTIPQYAYNEEETLKVDMNDTAGVNEASRGQMPSASIPAIGMQLLVEQDDTRIGVETESHEHSYAALGKILLKFVAKYYETPRLLKIVGQDMAYTIKEFKGEDLKDNFDVKVIRGSTLPGSKVLKRQEIINLHQAGYFGNPADPTVLQNVLSMLEYGHQYQAWKKQSLTMRQIERGIEALERGELVHVSEFDKHDLWIQELDNYRLSDKFLLLDDQAKANLLLCMEEHLEFLSQMTGQVDDPETNPELQPTTAAQEEEAQLMAEGAAQGIDVQNLPIDETQQQLPPQVGA